MLFRLVKNERKHMLPQRSNSAPDNESPGSTWFEERNSPFVDKSVSGKLRPEKNHQKGAKRDDEVTLDTGNVQVKQKMPIFENRDPAQKRRREEG